MVTAAMKRCLDCGEVKPVSDFRRRSGQGDGYHPYCKPCHSRRDRQVLGARTWRRLAGGGGPRSVIAPTRDEGGRARCPRCSGSPRLFVDGDHLACLSCGYIWDGDTLSLEARLRRRGPSSHGVML